MKQYALLLKTIGDEDNFRSLVQRALKAIEDDAPVLQLPLWDMLLKFECEGAKTAGDLKAIKELEVSGRAKERKEALEPSNNPPPL